ncbi:hypothetical protein ACFO3O_15625 [Dokdonia ponticola]|uniref:DUF2726 domain-containing protein n=1 Tax=Dokdonia ponticola TaxID=2041041 RepID=A0ABV9HYY3_9FLAO
MGVLGGLLIIAGFIGVLFFIISLADRPIYKEEKESEALLKKRLEDPRIYDPETDTYITLEEAESGIWDLEDASKKMSETEKREQFFEEDLVAESIRKELIKEGFVKVKSPLSEEQFKVFERLQLLDQLDENWGYRYFFENAKMIAIILTIHNAYELALSIPIQYSSGHYIFKEKTISDRILDKIRPDDAIQVADYECFPIQNSKTTRAVENIMHLVAKVRGVEVEILPHQFFIKTTGSQKLVDVFVLLDLVKEIEKNGY